MNCVTCFSVWLSAVVVGDLWLLPSRYRTLISVLLFFSTVLVQYRYGSRTKCRD